MLPLKILLFPVSLIYSLIIYIRNKFYDTGILPSYKISKPVISIGNITTGGTGKTPFTIFIAKYFLNKGKKIGIISRGYSRNSQDTIIVCDGENINSNVQQSGDELILISEELIKYFKGNFFVAAGSERVETSNLLINKFNPDVIILDDAFQHRKIKRDLDIVLVDAEDFIKNKFINTFTLPAGNLREGLSNLYRADLIIQNNKSSEINSISKLENYNKNNIVIRYKTEYFMDYKNSILQKSNCSAILFSGIANDNSFIRLVKDWGINITGVNTFPDHHNYTADDINLLEKKYSNNIFITTEKDFIKIKKFKEFVSDYPVYYLKMKIEITKNKNIVYDKLDILVK
ncbi:MAG: tetraacyldisaccharide 4'-kinase [Bacteroidota bacterium]|nr:tetraacyldisaccharide 4'-kinase [Bacteroidota bacterium]